MRTTIRLDDQVLKSAKRFAHDTGRTLTAVIEDALRRILSQRPAKVRRTRVKLTTVNGHGVHRGIDLDDSASLLAMMEEPNGST